MTSLPSPRTLLTSLLDSISSPSPVDPATNPHTQAQTQTHHSRDPPLLPNPLRDAPGEKAALLSTLHVLFPSLLLPALDLLDRGLVARGEGTGQKAEETGVEYRNGHDSDLYVVRSLASTMRGKGGAGGTSRYYLVLLGAWNCTCPSFTFDAFPPLATASLASGHGMATAGTAGRKGRDEQRGSGGDGRGEEWSFGGMSIDGTGAGTPCCKHLLACVLAERWGDVLGVYAPLKTIGRGEMAGLVADV